MRTSGSRPTWQTAIAFVVFVGTVMGLVYVFRRNLLALVGIFGLLGAGLSLTAIREETREAKLARVFMGPFFFSTYLYTIPEIDAALIPAVVFWFPVMYYGFKGVINEDLLGVHDDRTENQ